VRDFTTIFLIFILHKVKFWHNTAILKLEELGIEADPIELDNSSEALEVLRHSTAHLMAQAIKSLYPDAEFYVGPVVKEGFYYDFKTSQTIGEDDLKAIEKAMLNIAKQKLQIQKYDISKDEAIEKFKDDHLKQAVLQNIPSQTVSIYKQGDFEDLCRGPHLPNVGLIRLKNH